jgi:hypothetical protein
MDIPSSLKIIHHYVFSSWMILSRISALIPCAEAIPLLTGLWFKCANNLNYYNVFSWNSTFCGSLRSHSFLLEKSSQSTLKYRFLLESFSMSAEKSALTIRQKWQRCSSWCNCTKRLRSRLRNWCGNAMYLLIQDAFAEEGSSRLHNDSIEGGSNGQGIRHELEVSV